MYELVLPMTAPGNSPVFDRARQVRASVTQPNSRWTFGLGIVGAIALGLFTFSALSNGREAAPKPAPHPIVGHQAHLIAPAAVLVRVAQVTPAPVPGQSVSDQQTTPQSWRAPAMIVDLSEAKPASASAQAKSAAADDKLSPDERFSLRVTSDTTDTARASRLKDVASVAPQGTVIPAVLETAIDSDVPGFARAVISQDVRGFDGTKVLIPRGSKLIGQYKSGVAQGQTRAFVVWSRILTPDGISIDVGSPSTDPLGRGGLSGETDTHFLERFGSAILLSVITSGLDALSQTQGSTDITIGSSTQANQVASVALQKQIDIPPTIKVPQGTPLQVFLAKDLDFSTLDPK
jgi:type IV secretory pathway VirB10-like protein